jgi:hypothetical protein
MYDKEKGKNDVLLYKDWLNSPIVPNGERETDYADERRSLYY